MNNVIEFLFLEQNLFFQITGAILIAIFALQMIALMLGTAFDVVGLDGDFHTGNDIGGALDWINPGRVPLTILLTLFLGALTVIGYSSQWALRSFDLPMLPPLMVVPMSAMLSLPFVRVGSTIFNKMMPDDITTAVKIDDLFGYYGEVTLGPIDSNMMGQAKFKDDHGTTHYLTVVAESGSKSLDSGQSVVLLGRLSEDDNTVFLIRAV